MHDARASEQARLERARGGDREAYGELVREHLPRIHGLLLRLAGNHEDAEDLAQEVFVRAWAALPRYREEARFESWLRRIAVHLARDHFRHLERRRRLDDALARELREPVAPAASPQEAGATRRELSRQVDAALQRLPRRLREALVLRVFHGLEYDEVARASGATANTSRTHVMQARKLLLRWLGGAR
jgi:RNA polymerase sigma factor (sigma-70 family)